ncbi:uncharacterized protein N7498_002227 [Penicillium cinerascens]|uniref:Uncharacterized protein n=1 Tax=Penicillium cinerascens TaxID=70096 RepID=A0A9W9N9M3_9EURO|nr:uncharacterized protein N7498_002227 [Penicillium cinerascens]KAJ5215820.1 hypothetical protein N7498_002227 [Penicillium cinerascens]
MPVPSKLASNPLFEMFYKPPLTWADHVTNYIDGLLPQVDIVDDTTDSSSDEYSPSDSLFVELDTAVEDISVTPGVQQLTREEFIERFHFTQKYWPIEEVSTEGDSDIDAPSVPESSGRVAGESPHQFESPFHAEVSRQLKTPPQVVDSQATHQDTKFVSSPYITNPPSQKKTPSKGSRRAGTHRRHRKKVPKKAKAKGKQKDQPAEAASTFTGAATLDTIDPMTIAAPVACRSSAEAATLMSIVDPVNISTRASSPIDSSEPVIIATPINLPPSPFPSWRSSPSPPWEKVISHHKYHFKERMEYREKQTTASERPLSAPSSATHGEEMSTMTFSALPSEEINTMPSPVLPSVEMNTTPSPVIPSEEINITPSPSCLSMEVASVCSEVSTEVMEAISTTDTHRDTSEESVERTPVAPAPILLFSKEDTESSTVPEAASMTENHPDTSPESVEGTLVLPAPAVTVSKEEPESAVVDTEAPSKTEIRYALTPAVLTSTPNTGSSIFDTVITPETKSLDAFAPTVPTLGPEHTPPFIVDSNEYYKKIRERQPDMDKVQAFEEGMRYAHELREDEERRAAAEWNQRQSHYAQQNQTTYYHTNGMPMIASAAAFPWYQPEGSNTLASVPYPYLVQHTPQGMYPLSWQRMNSHYWNFDEACAHQENPYQYAALVLRWSSRMSRHLLDATTLKFPGHVGATISAIPITREASLRVVLWGKITMTIKQATLPQSVLLELSLKVMPEVSFNLLLVSFNLVLPNTVLLGFSCKVVPEVSSNLLLVLFNPVLLNTVLLELSLTAAPEVSFNQLLVLLHTVLLEASIPRIWVDTTKMALEVMLLLVRLLMSITIITGIRMDIIRALDRSADPGSLGISTGIVLLEEVIGTRLPLIVTGTIEPDLDLGLL